MLGDVKARLARWLKLSQHRLEGLKKEDAAKLAAWESELSARNAELSELTAQLRAHVEQRKALGEKVRELEALAERALARGDEAVARAHLLKKQDWNKLLVEGRAQGEVILRAVRASQDRLAATRSRANEELVAAGLPPLDEPQRPSPSADEEKGEPPEAEAPKGDAPRIRVDPK